MTCRICANETYGFARATILSKYEIGYFCCENCGYLQTETPYWLSESYSSAINLSDTGLVQRNQKLSSQTAAVIHSFFNPKAKFIDYAGGFGLFTRLMRDFGYDFYHTDIYAENLLAKGFEVKEAPKDKFELLTTFECFEHLPEPMREIEEMLNWSDNILFSTVLYPTPMPKPGDWWYYGLEHGQHVGIYSEKTIKFIAAKFGLNYINFGSLHLLTKKNISPFRFKLTLKLHKMGWMKSSLTALPSKTYSDSEMLKKLHGTV